MRQLAVCVGSSCHLRGAYHVIEELKRLIAEHRMEDQINLKACFCLGECQEGVSVQLDDRTFHGLTREKIDPFFREHFLDKGENRWD